MREKKFGFFGGTFDPIHFGHLNLAVHLLEMHNLDKIVVCPAQYSPHKSGDQPHISAKHRYQMTALAISPIEKLEISDLEIHREGPSYTIDTVRALIKENSTKDQDIRWHLILGEDSLNGFSQWKEVEELVQLASPLIGSRIGQLNALDLQLSAPLFQAMEKGLTKIPIMEISSTAIRERLRQKRYCGHLVPARVLEYINEHKLY
ncbi:MAG TPA: nicotinate-nucleotide adenylyltransferase [Rhabdochlamydiaceae bacterium]|nr:nicotinate-nucleotide adenylyltransferase [Rhabdochlamydiaceae bacterium]